MPDAALDVGNAPAGVALVPGSVEVLGGGAKLDNEVARQVLRLGLPTLLAPELDQGRFITAHDNAGVRAADERAPTQNPGISTMRSHLHLVLLF
jgi:hypothetical protein